MKADRILIINPFGIGDVLFTTPLIRRLRKQFKDSFIGFICNSRVEPILSSNKNLDEVFVFDKGGYKALWNKSKIGCTKNFFNFLKTIKSKKFDVVIDLSLGHQYSFFLKFLGVPVRIGYNFKNRGRFLTHKLNIDGYSDKHIVEYYLGLFDFLCKELAVIPKEDPDKTLEIFVDSNMIKWAEQFLRENFIDTAERLIAIIPGGGASWGKTAIYKQWPAENFANVADELISKYGFKVMFLGGPDDLDVCCNVSDLTYNKPMVVCGKTDLLQFVSLIKKCRLVICNDGGPLHIAVAAGVKTISLFGPVDENVYGPYPPSLDHIVMKEDISCRPCYKKFKLQDCLERRCLLSIRPQDVINAAVGFLDNGHK